MAASLARVRPNSAASTQPGGANNPQFAGKTFTFGPVTAEGTVNTINSTTDSSVIFELSPQVLELPEATIPGRVARVVSDLYSDVAWRVDRP